MAQTCPACGTPASGIFCSQCGSSLEAAPVCGGCGNPLAPDARFCNMCGAAAGAAPVVREGAATAGSGGTGNPRLPWLVTGAAVLVLLAVLVFARSERTGSQGAFPPQFSGAGDARSVDLASMTPRQAADSLFNRVMRSVSAGDTTQARAFAPMAIGAYRVAEPLDLDGRYHLAVLHLVNEDGPGARREAEAILEEVPSHLFGLFTAAQAEEMMGNDEEAAMLYGRFLENYDAEAATARTEYAEHSQLLPVMREEAAQRAG